MCSALKHIAHFVAAFCIVMGAFATITWALSVLYDRDDCDPPANISLCQELR